jgi:hypothetical protein
LNPGLHASPSGGPHIVDVRRPSQLQPGEAYVFSRTEGTTSLTDWCSRSIAQAARLRHVATCASAWTTGAAAARFGTRALLRARSAAAILLSLGDVGHREVQRRTDLLYHATRIIGEKTQLTAGAAGNLGSLLQCAGRRSLACSIGGASKYGAGVRPRRCPRKARYNAHVWLRPRLQCQLSWPAGRAPAAKAGEGSCRDARAMSTQAIFGALSTPADQTSCAR